MTRLLSIRLCPSGPVSPHDDSPVAGVWRFVPATKTCIELISGRLGKNRIAHCGPSSALMMNE
jgi:hypothetical protein